MTDSPTPSDVATDTAVPPATNRVPGATYRLQLTPAFTFDNAARQVPYLARLGITHVYLSPIFRAKPGSTHGYDVCDFGELNPELGGAAGFARLVASLKEHDMGLVQDFVPNHMAVEPVLNPWWRSMLEHGPASPHAGFFDVDWNPMKPELRGKVLLPFLGDYYGKVLDRGELKVEYSGGEFVVRHFERTRPIDPKQYPRILRVGLDSLKAELGEGAAVGELLSIVSALDTLAAVTDLHPERVAHRLRESRIAKERLARLVQSAPRIGGHIQQAVTALNGTPNRPESFDALHELLDALPFRLAYWKTAVHEINYRRFFDINDLAGLRPEEPDAFHAMHHLLLQLIGDGAVTGVRLDHIDGLFDPVGYAVRLQEAVRQHLASLGRSAPEKPLYVLVEKILTGDEPLPAWPVEGTTGYDFLNDVSRLFVAPTAAPALRKFHATFTDRTDPFREVVYDCKKLITWTSLASELNVLADALDRLSEVDRHTRDFTLDSLREALREVAVCFPVYRTYIGARGATDADRGVIDTAIRRARQKNPAMEASVFDFLRANLLPDREGVGDDLYQRRLRFAMKFQQYTGPLQAKGLEDTSFYRYNVLVSLNEVGGDPQRFGGTVEEFHNANTARRERAPHAMLCTATHDTKRGEDARARVHVLSEAPKAWQQKVKEWAEINAGCRAADAPDRGDEYLFYQTLIGCWPADHIDRVAPPELVERLQAYMQKAIKEAKIHTSWITPNDAYDQAVSAFVGQVLTGPTAADFLASFVPFQRRVALGGLVNSLAQVVLKATSPGVPDFYQGSELWEFSLVDPDNRRPVDYDRRRDALANLTPWFDGAGPAPVAEWLQHWPDGRIKLYVTACCLHLRRSNPDLFTVGEYIPLAADGRWADRLVAFSRRDDDDWTAIVVPRLSLSLTRKSSPFPLGDVWGDTTIRLPTELADRSFRDVFTSNTLTPSSGSHGSSLRVADVLAVCPVAVLHSPTG